MNPLYLDLLVSAIAVDQGCLVIKNVKTNKVIERFKPRECPYDSFVIQKGNGMITLSALNWLALHGINVSLLDWRGNITSEILPREPISNRLKLAQYRAYLDRSTHLFIARSIVETKLQRQREFLVSLSRSYPMIEVPRIGRISASSEDFIRNQEARFAVSYFVEFGKVCRELGHDFTGRGTKNNMHANDLPNALLNYGYAVLQTYVRRALNAIGLDNSIPFLHDMRRNTGLVYDLMELWRTNVDYSVLQTLEQLHSIGYNVFRLNDNFEAVLSPQTAKLLFEKTRFNLSLQEIIFNTRVFGNYLLGDRKTLEFVLNPVQANEVFETQKVKGAILSKTARELNMNKSTHWYQRKQLRDRGSVRLYNSTKQYYVK